MLERWLIASLAVGLLLLLRVIVQRLVAASREGAGADAAGCHGGGCMRACTRAPTSPDEAER